MLRISGLMDDVMRLRLLDVTVRRDSEADTYAALSLARRNTRRTQRTLGTTSCSQGLLGPSRRVEYL